MSERITVTHEILSNGDPVKQSVSFEKEVISLKDPSFDIWLEGVLPGLGYAEGSHLVIVEKK